MIIYKKILGFLVSFLLSIFLLGAYYFPERFYLFIFLSLFLVFFYFWSIKNRFVTYSLLLKYALVVLTFLIAIWFFFVVIDITIVKYITTILLFICLLLIFEGFFKKVYSNQDISHPLIVYIDLVCFWLISYFLFYALVLFRMGIPLTSLILSLFIIILSIIRFYWHQIDIKKNILYILILILILVQIYIITSFLALNFYSSSFILWIWYYLLMDFFVDKIKEDFIWSKKKKTIFFMILLFIFYLFSVR